VQQARAEKARRVKARRHFLDFCQYVWPGFQDRPHRALIASALEGALERRWTRLMIFVPPQYGKSTQVSRMLPAWWLGRLPDERIIQTSYAASLATGFSREARNLLRTPEYAALFGRRATVDVPVELATDSSAVDEWRLAHHRGGLAAAGVGGGITGKSANLGNIDDPLKDDKDARSEIIREGQKAWYSSTFYTRLAPDGVVILTMTRWHDDDLAGWLLQEQARGGDLWHVLRLPAVAEAPADRADWLERNHVTPDRYLIGSPDAGGRLHATPWAAAADL
jgi:hypothetical protein